MVQMLARCVLANHRYVFSKIGGEDYNLDNPKSLNPAPPGATSGAWAADYKRMLEEMIYEENPPSFYDLRSVNELKARREGLEWEYSLDFPKTK